MRLTILLPTHNRADVLPWAIESVLAQTFSDFELLIVGDGCTDETAEVVAAFSAREARVRWLSYPKGAGVGYENRNRALEEAAGDLIGYMAHDDLIAPGHYARLVEMLEDPAAHLAYTSAVWVAPHGDMVPTIFHLEDEAMRQGLQEGVWNRLPMLCFMHRRQALAEVGYWNESLETAGDMDYWGRILSHYGSRSVRGSLASTAFHFRAHWRTPDYINPDNEPAWVRLHSAPGRLNPSLKLDVTPFPTEQEALFHLLKTQPAMAEQIGEACQYALKTHAWEMEKEALGHAAHLQQLLEMLAQRPDPAAWAAAQARQETTFRQIERLEERLAALQIAHDSLRAEQAALQARANVLMVRESEWKGLSRWQRLRCVLISRA